MEVLEPRQMMAVTALRSFANSPTAGNTTYNLREYFRTDSSLGSVVRFNVSAGNFTGSYDVALFDGSTPRTVNNFLNYVVAGSYNNAFFHRLVQGFVLQGGGFAPTGNGTNPFTTVPVIPNSAGRDFTVKNEFSISPRDPSGKVNTIYTISMAKTGLSPNSATNQFFISLADNSANLDNQNGGFTVFGSVTASGQSTINTLGNAPVFNLTAFGDDYGSVPALNVASGVGFGNLETITSASVVTQGLTFQATSSNTNVVTASLANGFNLTLTTGGQTGTSLITITATDRSGGTLTQTFTYSSSRPTFAVPTLTTGTQEGATSLPVTVTNASNANLLYSIDYDTDGAFDVTGSTTGTFAIPAQFLNEGNYDQYVTIRATDANGISTDVTVPYFVQNVAPTPTVNASGSLVVNQPITLTGTATDPSPSDTQRGFSYSWTISRLGSGSPTQVASAIYNPRTNPSPNRTFSFTPTDGSIYRVSLVGFDGKYTGTSGAGSTGMSAAVTQNLTTVGVAAIAPITEGTTNATVSLTGTPGAGTFTYSFDFDNNGTFEITTSSQTSVTIPASFVADGPATRTLRVRVTDTSGNTADVTSTYSVTNVAPSPAILVGTPGVAPGVPVLLTGSATDPSPADTSNGFTFNWTITRQGQSGTFATGTGSSFQFTPTDTSTYVASLTAVDKDGGSNTTTANIVSIQGPGVVINPIGSIPEGSNGTVTLSNPLDPRNNNPASLTYSYDFDNNGTFEVTGSTLTSATIPSTFASDGPATRTLRVRVTDSAGAFTDFTSTYSVTDVPPTADFAFTSGTNATVGTTVVLTGSATDPSAADTTAGFTYRWSVTRVGEIGSPFATGTGSTFTFTPSFVATYQVSVTAVDKDGGTSVATSKTLAVTANPNDTQAPTLTVLPPNAVTGASTLTIRVGVTDNVQLLPASIVANAFSLTVPGTSAPVGLTLQTVTTTGNVSTAVLTYTAPAGGLVAGNYSLNSTGGQIVDVNGNLTGTSSYAFSVAGVPTASRAGDVTLSSASATGAFSTLLGQGVSLQDFFPTNAATGFSVLGLASGGVSVYRFNLDGSLASTTAVSLPSGFTATSARYEYTGNIMVLGTFTTTVASGSVTRPAAARFTTPTTIDASSTFGASGVLVLQGLGTSDYIGAAVSPQSIVNSGLYVGGRLASTNQLFVAKFNADGTIDTRFGTRGYFTMPASTSLDAIKVLGISGNGSLVAGGVVNSVATVFRLTSRGRAISGVSANGLRINVPGAAYSEVDDLALQNDGRLFVSVATAANGASAAAGAIGQSVVRVLTNNRVDTTFGSNGYVTALATPASVTSTGSPLARTQHTTLNVRSTDLLTVSPVLTAAGTQANFSTRQLDYSNVSVTNATTPSVTVRRGQRVTARFLVGFNTSQTISGRFSTTLILSKNNVLGDADDITLLSTPSFSVSRQASGSRFYTARGTLPSNITSSANGSYTLYVRIAPATTGGVADQNPADNSVVATGTVTLA